MFPTHRPIKQPKQVFITLYIQLHPLELNPPIWRRVLVGGHLTLHKLHHVIQAAMGWESRHLYEFIITEQRYGLPDPLFEDDRLLDARRQKLAKLVKAGDRLRYLYDFGDGWEHVIAVENIQAVPHDDYADNARVLDGERACPPEDVGGAIGYEDFLERLAGPAGEDRDDALRWVGGRFDRDVFEVRQANAAVQRLVSNEWI